MEMWIAAIATGVIAIYAILSYRLTSKLNKSDAIYRQEVKDLYQAIVISNLMQLAKGAPVVSTIENAKREFSKHYEGQTEIF
jgi:hypothetical protein